MSEEVQKCPECSRKIMQSVSNRCMYCGVDLPEEHHLTQEEKSQLFTEKMEVFKKNAENAEDIINTLRQDFGTSEKSLKKQRVKERSKAVTDAEAEINELISAHQEKNNSN